MTLNTSCLKITFTLGDQINGDLDYNNYNGPQMSTYYKTKHCEMCNKKN